MQPKQMNQQTLQTRLNLPGRCAGLCLALLMLGAAATTQAASIYKADNSNPLNMTGSWTNNALPGAADTAFWDLNVATPANATNSLGGDMTWTGITIVNPAAAVQINSGNTLTLTNVTMSAATVDLSLNCGLIVGGAPTWQVGANATTTRKLTVGSAVTGTGNIKQQYGKIILAPGAGSFPGSMTYSWSGTGTLDLGGNSQRLSALGPAWGASSIVTNGNLTLTNNMVWTPQGNSTIDLSGLSSLTYSNPAQAFTFYNNHASTIGTVTVNLAKQGPGTNFIASSALNVGNTAPASVNNQALLHLGKDNVFWVNNSMIVGSYKNALGLIDYQTGVTNPSLTLVGAGGVNPVNTIQIGYCNSGAVNSTGIVDVAQGTFNCLANTLTIGQQNAGANTIASGTLNFGTGTISALSLVLAQKDANNGTPSVIGNLNQSGGVVKAGTLTLGQNNGTVAGVTMKGAYNLNGGTLQAQTIQAGTIGASENGASYRAIFWTNGVIRNYDASTDLAMTGGTISAYGNGARYFTPDTGRSVSVQTKIDQGSLTATPLVMNGAGTLDLAGSVDNPWTSINASNGVVLLDKSSGGAVHAIGSDFFINGGTVRLSGSGGDQVADTRIAHVTSGTFDVNAQTESIGGLSGAGGSVADTAGGGTLTFNVANGTNFAFGGSLNNTFNLAKTGAGKQTLYGTDVRAGGADTVDQGILEIGNGGGTGTLASSVTVNAAGSLSFNRSGTFNFAGTISGAGDVTQNGPGTLILSGADSHTGGTLANTGTLGLPAGGTSVGGSVVKVASGAIFDVTAGGGNFAVGPNQTLNGAGTVQGSFYIGSGGTLQSNLTINGSVTATDGSTNNPGALFSAGTITVNGNFTNTGNNFWVYNLAGVTNIGGGVNPLLSISGRLDLGNPANANSPTLVIHGSPVSGRYTLATFGSFTGNPGSLVVVGSARYIYTPRIVGNALVLDIAGNNGNLVWRGDGSADSWDNSAANKDWFNLGTSALDAFNPNDNVLFNDTSTYPVVNLNDTVLPATVTVNATQNYTFTSTSSIDGPTALTKTNSGTLTIANNNSFTGPVNLNGGALSVASVALNGSASPLGAGTTLVFNGGTLQYTGPAVGAAEFNRQVSLGIGGGTIDQASSGGIYLFLTNLISGPGSLVKTGAQQLIIGDIGAGAGNNTYSGITYVVEGDLQIRHTNALGSTTGKTIITEPGNVAAAGGLQGTILEPFDLSGDGGGNGALQANDGGTAVTFAGNINLVTNAGIGGGAALAIAGPLSGPGMLTKAGGGTVTFLNTPTYLGGTFISSGTLQLGTNGTAGWLPPQPIATPLTNNGTLAFNRSDTNTYAASITGSGGLRQSGSGTTILTGSNSFSGTVNINAGALRAAGNNAMGVGNVYTPYGNSYATLELAANCTISNNLIQIPMHNAHTPAHIRNVSGTNVIQGTIEPAPGGTYWDISSEGGYLVIDAGIVPRSDSGGGWRTLYLNGAAGGRINGVYDQSLISPSANVNLEVMAGAWTLATNNLYGGTTVVDAGSTLLAENDPAGSATGTGAVTVNGTLGGNGYLGGPVTVNSTGQLAPGAGGIGTLTFNSNLRLGGNLAIEVNRSLTQSNDYVAVNGVLTNSGTGTVIVANLGPALVAGDTFLLFNQPVPNGSALSIAGGGASVTWANNLEVDGSISVVSVTPPAPPTPTGIGLLPDGNISLVATGAVGTAWSLHATTNVIQAAPWPVITSGTISTSPFMVNDLSATNSPRRFYYFSAP